MKHSSLNRTIVYILICIIILGGILFGIKSYQDYSNNQLSFISTLSSNNMHVSKNASLLISEVMLTEKELVNIAVQKLQTMDLQDDKKIREFIFDRSAGFTTVGGFYFGRRDGTQFINTNGQLPPDYNPTERSWYKQAENKKGLIITDAYVDSLTKKVCVTIAAPVFQNESIMGVIGLDIFIDKFYNIFENLSADKTTLYYVTDYYGNIIIRDNIDSGSSHLADELDNLTSDANISSLIRNLNWETALGSKDGSISIGKSNDNKLLGYYWTLPEEGWKVIAITDPAYYSSEISRMKMDFYSFGIMIIFLILFLILIAASINLYIEKVRMKFMLTHDVLTGLPNRNYLEIYYKNEMETIRETIGCSLILIDIDNFKFINDTYGHAIGDEILTNIARILMDMVPRDGLLLRSGGDEFAVLLSNISIQSAKYFTERLHSSVCDNPIIINNKYFDVSISTGYTVIDNRTNIMKFFSHANAALKTAKEEGKNKVVCLLPDDINMSIDDPGKINELIDLIKNAVRDDRFVLFLQPIVELDSRRIKHYEALIRLRGKDGRLISPGIFIPIAERFSLISEIDHWVFEEVMKIISKHPQTTIFMNISGLSLTNTSLLELFEKRILESSIDPDHLRLGLEITETASTKNFLQAQNWMDKFKGLGCEIALDDFGVGYTSFTYLRSLPVDYIKIDGSFVHNIDKDSSHRAIVQTINTLAISLGKSTIAEFVENEAVLKVLKEIGVKCGQGYHLGKPGPVKDNLKFEDTK